MFTESLRVKHDCWSVNILSYHSTLPRSIARYWPCPHAQRWILLRLGEWCLRCRSGCGRTICAMLWSQFWYWVSNSECLPQILNSLINWVHRIVWDFEWIWVILQWVRRLVRLVWAKGYLVLRLPLLVWLRVEIALFVLLLIFLLWLHCVQVLLVSSFQFRLDVAFIWVT